MWLKLWKMCGSTSQHKITWSWSCVLQVGVSREKREHFVGLLNTVVFLRQDVNSNVDFLLLKMLLNPVKMTQLESNRPNAGPRWKWPHSPSFACLLGQTPAPAGRGSYCMYSRSRHPSSPFWLTLFILCSETLIRIEGWSRSRCGRGLLVSARQWSKISNPRVFCVFISQLEMVSFHAAPPRTHWQI